MVDETTKMAPLRPRRPRATRFTVIAVTGLSVLVGVALLLSLAYAAASGFQLRVAAGGGAPASGLAATGFDLAPLVPAALVLFVVGVLAAVMGRRATARETRPLLED